MIPERPQPAPARAAAPSRARSLGLLLAKIAIALGLLAFVAWRLPWHDQLKLKQGGREHVLSGALEGNWREARVQFRFDAGQQADAAWPAEIRAAAASSAALVWVERAPADAREGLSWQPSLPRVFREVRVEGLWIGLALFSAAMLCGVTRWWRLLALAGCRVRWWDALRLTFVGLFFNMVMPGLTGGDLVKAVAVARENPARKLGAVLSIFVDRIIGLFSLLVLTAVVVLISGETFAVLRLPVLGATGLALAGTLAYASAPLRRLLRIDALLAKLPMADKLRLLDEALLVYSRRPLELALAAALSLCNHIGVILGVWALGRAYGVLESDVHWLEYFAIVPVANIVTALPLAPAGWGLGEAVYQTLFELVGSSAALGVAVSATYRICQMVLSFAGGLFLLAPGARAEMAAARAQAESGAAGEARA